MVEVTILREERNMTLVQWTDEYDVLQRNWVKVSMVTDRWGKTGRVENPQRGYPYGVDFSHALSPSVTSHDICRELRKRGLWTAEDLQKNPELIKGALQAAYGVDLSQIIAIAKQYEKTMEE